MALIAIAAIEQVYLKFYLDDAAVRRDEDYIEFIHEIKTRPGGLESINRRECKSIRIAVIWTYRVCVEGGFTIATTNEKSFLVVVQKPAGWFTLIPSDGDRLLWDGEAIFQLNSKGEIVSDLREQL